MKRSTIEERKAYCVVHGHSWIQVAYSSYRRCSWCEVYEESSEQKVSRPEIPLAERGTLNGRGAWSLLG